MVKCTKCGHPMKRLVDKDASIKTWCCPTCKICKVPDFVLEE